MQLLKLADEIYELQGWEPPAKRVAPAAEARAGAGPETAPETAPDAGAETRDPG